MAEEKTLTTQQEVFVNTFLTECFAGTEQHLAAVIAKNTAGYVEEYPLDSILTVVSHELVRRCQGRLTLAAPKAIAETVGVMIDPTKDGSRRILEAANSILDRVGITKKDHMELEVKAENGIVIIPAKRT